MIDYELLRAEIDRHPYPLVFATVSGAHLYGFPSVDSDYDLRGVHVLPAEEVVGLLPTQETVVVEGMRSGREMDLVTHDIRKFFALLLRPNGYVLEQLYSPLIVHTTQAYLELKEIARGCVTRHHSHHYLGFAAKQWELFGKENPPRVKPLLYVFRVLLTGIHLMRTGEVEANLLTLNDDHRLPYIGDLLQRKTSGLEKGALDAPEIAFYAEEFRRLRILLEDAAAISQLPESPTALKALNDLLVRVRLGNLA